MKQTAVAFMVEQLNQSIGLTKFVDVCDEAYKNEILTIIKTAKEIEQQQIIEAAMWMPEPFNNIEFIPELAKQYYNDKYGKM
jgi:hypothetical protein